MKWDMEEYKSQEAVKSQKVDMKDAIFLKSIEQLKKTREFYHYILYITTTTVWEDSFHVISFTSWQSELKHVLAYIYNNNHNIHIPITRLDLSCAFFSCLMWRVKNTADLFFRKMIRNINDPYCYIYIDIIENWIWCECIYI